ncbi:unnamed protein product [Agarophyton chilense]
MNLEILGLFIRAVDALEFEFFFAESVGNNPFPFEIQEPLDFQRNLDFDKLALADLNMMRSRSWRGILNWSSYMNGMALQISLRQLREGAFNVETQDSDCVASSFIVQTLHGAQMMDWVMELAMMDGVREGVEMNRVYLRSTMDDLGLNDGQDDLSGGVAMLVFRNGIMVTTVIGRSRTQPR